MKALTKIMVILTIGLTSCSSNAIKTENYPVVSFTKNDILVFVKKSEYKNPDHEKEIDNLITSCSRSFSTSEYKVYNRVVTEDESVSLLTKGVILVRVWDEDSEVISGLHQKSLFLKFEKIPDGSRYVQPIHGVKSTLTDNKPLSLENIDQLCSKAVKSIDF
jgi:hypothetical protein